MLICTDPRRAHFFHHLSFTMRHQPDVPCFCIALLWAGRKKLKCASCLLDFHRSLEFAAILSTRHLHHAKFSYRTACPSYIYSITHCHLCTLQYIVASVSYYKDCPSCPPIELCMGGYMCRCRIQDSDRGNARR